MKRKIISILAGLVCVGVLLAACGRKTAPIPLQAVIPAPVVDLAYELDEKGVTLSWSAATRTEQGKRLPGVDKFLVERAAYEIRDFCENCPVRYKEVAAIVGDGPAGRKHQKTTYREELLRPGYVYFYRVRSKMGWRVVSRPSTPVSFRWQLPVAAPRTIKGQVGDQQISLSWQPPLADSSGKLVDEKLLYQVYRRGGDGDFRPLGRPVAELEFVDRPLINGEVYQYKVRAFRLSGGSGIFGSMVEIMPRDLTPPPTPQGLSGIITPDGVRLFWEPVLANDLGGYLVLRRSGELSSAKDYVVRDRVATAGTSFLDKTLNEQETYYYSIKSYDLASPANESPLADEIKIQWNR